MMKRCNQKQVVRTSGDKADGVSPRPICVSSVLWSPARPVGGASGARSRALSPIRLRSVLTTHVVQETGSEPGCPWGILSCTSRVRRARASITPSASAAPWPQHRIFQAGACNGWYVWIPGRMRGSGFLGGLFALRDQRS